MKRTAITAFAFLAVSIMLLSVVPTCISADDDFLTLDDGEVSIDEFTESFYYKGTNLKKDAFCSLLKMNESELSAMLLYSIGLLFLDGDFNIPYKIDTLNLKSSEYRVSTVYLNDSGLDTTMIITCSKLEAEIGITFTSDSGLSNMMMTDEYLTQFYDRIGGNIKVGDTMSLKLSLSEWNMTTLGTYYAAIDDTRGVCITNSAMNAGTLKTSADVVINASGKETSFKTTNTCNSTSTVQYTMNTDEVPIIGNSYDTTYQVQDAYWVGDSIVYGFQEPLEIPYCDSNNVDTDTIVLTEDYVEIIPAAMTLDEVIASVSYDKSTMTSTGTFETGEEAVAKFGLMTIEYMFGGSDIMSLITKAVIGFVVILIIICVIVFFVIKKHR